jgi:hypothetical protein
MATIPRKKKMTQAFGQVPYRECSYGEPRSGPGVDEISSDSPDDVVLRAVLESLKVGQFSAVERLKPFITHSSYDLRQYSHQLFAQVCNHTQVAWFLDALETIEFPEETYRLALRLGETLSCNALPVLRRISERHGDDSEVCEYILLALNILGNATDVADVAPERDAIRSALDQMEGTLAPPQYVYRGRPVFIGDVTKELVTAALIANREKRPAILLQQPTLLSNFTGMLCPVQGGQTVSDTEMEAVFEYVRKIAKKPWMKGTKCFYEFEI